MISRFIFAVYEEAKFYLLLNNRQFSCFYKLQPIFRFKYSLFKKTTPQGIILLLLLLSPFVPLGLVLKRSEIRFFD